MANRNQNGNRNGNLYNLWLQIGGWVGYTELQEENVWVGVGFLHSIESGRRAADEDCMFGLGRGAGAGNLDCFCKRERDFGAYKNHQGRA